VRLLGWIRRALELALVAWSTYQLLELALAWLRRPPAGSYPNTYGVRLGPLTAAERDAALERERTIARRLAELHESTPAPAAAGAVGSAAPAARASTTTVRPAGT
jgi:hypothetical protein